MCKFLPTREQYFAQECKKNCVISIYFIVSPGSQQEEATVEIIRRPSGGSCRVRRWRPDQPDLLHTLPLHNSDGVDILPLVLPPRPGLGRQLVAVVIWRGDKWSEGGTRGRHRRPGQSISCCTAFSSHSSRRRYGSWGSTHESSVCSCGHVCG